MTQNDKIPHNGVKKNRKESENGNKISTKCQMEIDANDIIEGGMTVVLKIVGYFVVFGILLVI